MVDPLGIGDDWARDGVSGRELVERPAAANAATAAWIVTTANLKQPGCRRYDQHVPGLLRHHFEAKLQALPTEVEK